MEDTNHIVIDSANFEVLIRDPHHFPTYTTSTAAYAAVAAKISDFVADVARLIHMPNRITKAVSTPNLTT